MNPLNYLIRPVLESLLRRIRHHREIVENWRKDVLDETTGVIHTISQIEYEDEINFDLLEKRLKDASKELRLKARNPPEGYEDTAEKVEALADVYQQAAVIFERSSEDSLEDVTHHIFDVYRAANMDFISAEPREVENAFESFGLPIGEVMSGEDLIAIANRVISDLDEDRIPTIEELVPLPVDDLSDEDKSEIALQILWLHLSLIVYATELLQNEIHKSTR